MTEIVEAPVSPPKANEDKSPEQANRVKDDLKISEEKPKKIFMPSSQNMSAL